jgi:hypothetical protein
LPLLARRGGRDIKKISRSLRWKERAGWWFSFKKSFRSLTTTPSPATKVASASFFLVPEPPLLSRRGDPPEHVDSAEPEKLAQEYWPRIHELLLTVGMPRRHVLDLDWPRIVDSGGAVGMASGIAVAAGLFGICWITNVGPSYGSAQE